MHDSARVAQAKFNGAILLHQRGQVVQATALCREIIEAEPAHFGAYYLLGLAALQARELPAAVEALKRSIALNSNQPSAHLNLGVALLDLGQFVPALESFERALQLYPRYALAWSNRGNALRLLGRHEEALASCEAALRLQPDLAVACNNRGIALLALKRPVEALAAFERALQLRPDLTDALNNCAGTLQDLKRHEEAAQRFAQLLSIVPDYEYALGTMLHARLMGCNWDGYESLAADVLRSVTQGKRTDSPFSFLGASDSAAAQLQCAQTYVAHQCPPVSPLWCGERYDHERIRLAYVSADLREHIVAFLMTGVLEAHDRSQFEVYGISLSPPENGDMGRRVMRACERFIDVSQKSDREVAQLLRELEIDIAIDLAGYTSGCRPAILAHRPAPVQVNYLGFPGTMGAPYIDYILADRFVIPAEQRLHYSERVVYMPGCFQANDWEKPLAARLLRTEVGLPVEALVFCCFNNGYKINPPMLSLWCELLRELPRSVLWLLADRPAAEANLRRELSLRGVGPERIVFAPRLGYAQHISRLHLADLYLDTLPFNAGATAGDALWAGVPVLTCAGRAFASRMAGSLLEALELPELITRDLREYRERALQLARQPADLAGLRARLAANRRTVFDSGAFCRHLERAYRGMWERQQRGEPPADFAVAR